MSERLDRTDTEILRILQKEANLTAKDIARRVNAPITTVFAKIKRMEKTGLIKEYRAVLDTKMIERGTSAFIWASFTKNGRISQRNVADEVAKLPDVQEVHIVAGDWDLLIKVKEKDVDAIGKFVVDKLRNIPGIDKTLTTFVFETAKESTSVAI